MAALIVPMAAIGIWAAAACMASLFAYVLRGWRLSGVGWRGLLDLPWAPAFVVWKVIVAVSGNRVSEWMRTDRERP